MPSSECDHRYIRDGEVVRRIGRDFKQTWARYVCERCLKPQFALIREFNGYTGTTEHKDGTRIVDRLEDL